MQVAIINLYMIDNRHLHSENLLDEYRIVYWEICPTKL